MIGVTRIHIRVLYSTPRSLGLTMSAGDNDPSSDESHTTRPKGGLLFSAYGGIAVALLGAVLAFGSFIYKCYLEKELQIARSQPVAGSAIVGFSRGSPVVIPTRTANAASIEVQQQSSEYTLDNLRPWLMQLLWGGLALIVFGIGILAYSFRAAQRMPRSKI
jgi:hypothetical protein